MCVYNICTVEGVYLRTGYQYLTKHLCVCVCMPSEA